MMKNLREHRMAGTWEGESAMDGSFALRNPHVILRVDVMPDSALVKRLLVCHYTAELLCLLLLLCRITGCGPGTSLPTTVHDFIPGLPVHSDGLLSARASECGYVVRSVGMRPKSNTGKITPENLSTIRRQLLNRLGVWKLTRVWGWTRFYFLNIKFLYDQIP
jgi:hypothetical protein